MVKSKQRKRAARLAAAPKQTRAKKTQELTRLGAALRTLGGLGGAALGGVVGQAGAGAGYGTSLGAMLSRWLGSGDYVVKSNSIVQSVLRSTDSIPSMHNTGQSITIRHKEYIAEVKGSKVFSVQRFFPIQPGDSNSFPWLSGIAPKFQQYRVKGMVFHYVPTSGTAVSGTNPALGSVMLQTSYRANDAAPGSKAEMLNEYWSSEGSPSEAFCHPIECDPKENPFDVHYVRTKPVAGADSLLLYDVGTLFLATSGMPDDNNVVGDLWVTYEVELSKPVVVTNISDNVESTLHAVASPVPGNWFAGTTTSTGAIEATFGGQVLNFPVGLVGTFLIVVRIQASTTFSAIDLSGAPSYTDCVSAPADATGSSYNRVVASGGTVSNGYYCAGVKITNPGVVAKVVFPNGTWTGTAANAFCTIVPLL